MKKVILNEQLLRRMLMEMTKESIAINEAITAQDAYNRFYANRLNKDTYNLAMGGTVNMTPFHKVMLEIIISNFEGNQGQANAVAAYGSNVWKQADANMRQAILKAVKTGGLDTSSPTAFMESLKKVVSGGAETKNQTSAKGLLVLYEDDAIIITCTLSYAASTKYYGMTSWCTASDIGGRYNGFYMFRSYTCPEYESYTADNQCLIQIVVKNDKSRMVQMAVNQYGDIDEDNVMNKEDECISLYMVQNMIANAGSNLDLNEFMDNQEWEDLADKTVSAVNAENDYWESKTIELVKQVQAKIDSEISGPEIASYLSNGIIEGWDEYGCDKDSGYYDFVANYLEDEKYDAYEMHGLGDYCVIAVELQGDVSSWLNSIPRNLGINTNEKRILICKKEDNTIKYVKTLPPVYTGVGGRANIIEIMMPYDEELGYRYFRINAVTGEALPYEGPSAGFVNGYEFFLENEESEVLSVVDVMSVKKVGEVVYRGRYLWDESEEIKLLDGRLVTAGQYTRELKQNERR